MPAYFTKPTTPRLRVIRHKVPGRPGVTRVDVTAEGGYATMAVGEARKLPLNSGDLETSARDADDRRVWAHILGVHVNPAQHGRGLGGAMLDRAIKIAGEIGAEGVSLEAAALPLHPGQLTQGPLMAFYERRGFRMYDPENPAAFLNHMVLDLRHTGSPPRFPPGYPPRHRHDWPWTGQTKEEQLAYREKIISGRDQRSRSLLERSPKTQITTRTNPGIPHRVQLLIKHAGGDLWQIIPRVAEERGSRPKAYELPEGLLLGMAPTYLFKTREAADLEASHLALDLLGEHAKHVEVLRDDHIVLSLGPDSNRWAILNEIEKLRPVPFDLYRQGSRWIVAYGKLRLPTSVQDGEKTEVFLRGQDLLVLHYTNDLDRIALDAFDVELQRLVVHAELEDPGTITFVLAGDPEGIPSAQAAQNLYDYALEHGEQS